MKKLILFSLIALNIVLTSCSSKITNENDYNKYLNFKTYNEDLSNVEKEISFWENKIKLADNQSPYYLKLASAQNAIFELNANVEFLNKAAKNIEKANSLLSFGDSSPLRSLAHNYISQHKFRDAEKCLLKADSLGAKKEVTAKMLFDINMEVGNYDAAEKFITKHQADMDFDILIRKAKYFDHQGNIKKAISTMELAKLEAEKANDEELKEWIYTNIADFYGHNGQIKDSYKHYLKALSINPNSSYALKGIAWILFSHEKNPKEALRIIENIEKVHKSPDYILFKSQIYAYLGQNNLSNKLEKDFIIQASDSRYGDMYNTYLIPLVNKEKALNIAKKEIDNRPTHGSYDLLAFSLYRNSKTGEALKVINTKVLNKTSEPMSLYHQAEIFKANGLIAQSKKIKEELKEAYYELGPILASKIEKI